MKQLWTLGNDGNAMALQVADLNNQIMNREKEITSLKQKSTADHKELKSEITRILNENKLLEEKIKEISAQASKGINASLVRSISGETNKVNNSNKDENLIPKLAQHENTIAQQKDLIKNLQEHILELEQLLDESCKNTSVGKDKNANNNQFLKEI
ncbi:hypothetical protein C1645_747487, partial [Glomus cerebriforme]